MPDATGSPLVWAAAGAAATIAAGLLAKRLGAFRYQPPRVWKFNAPSGGAFAAINAPTSGARVEKALPVGEHPIQLYSLGTPNGVKVTIMLEELVAQIPTCDYDAWNIPNPDPHPSPSPSPIPTPTPTPCQLLAEASLGMQLEAAARWVAQRYLLRAAPATGSASLNPNPQPQP